jgi:uncharacterized protein (TIGR02246 family)
MFRAFSAFAALAILGLAAASVRAQEHGGKVVDDAWVKAVSAGDIEAAVALYSPDAVLYAPDSMEARGTEAIRAVYQGLLGPNTVSNATINATYQTSGDLSTGWGTATMTLTPKAGGPPQTIVVRVTEVTKKVNGKWLYVADHASVPMGPAPAK